MRKLLFVICALMFSVGALSAGPTGKTSLMPFQDTVLLGCDTMGIYLVTVSSTAATAVRAANTERKGVVIRNNYTDTVYLSTWAATSSSALWPIAAGAEDTDDTMPYTGALYILAPPTISSATVTIREKW